MSDPVKVPFGDKPSETATLLLAAAETLGLDAHVVGTNENGVFLVPEDVADEAGLGEGKPAKKAAAKKTAAKKSEK